MLTYADLEFSGRVRPQRSPCPEGRVRLYDLHAAKEAGYLKFKRFDGGNYHGEVLVSDISTGTTKGTGVLICIKPPTLSSSKYLSEALGVSSAVRERLLPCGDLEKAEYLACTITACCLAYANSDTTSD